MSRRIVGNILRKATMSSQNWRRLLAALAIPTVYWLTAGRRFDISGFATICVPVLALIFAAFTRFAHQILVAGVINAMLIGGFLALVILRSPDTTMGESALALMFTALFSLAVSIFFGIALNGWVKVSSLEQAAAPDVQP
jgi:hypothetical protein